MSPNSPCVNSGPTWQVVQRPRPTKSRRPRCASIGIAGRGAPVACRERITEFVERRAAGDRACRRRRPIAFATSTSVRSGVAGGGRLGRTRARSGTRGPRSPATTASTCAALPAISRAVEERRIACDQMLSAAPSQPYQRSWTAFHSDGALRSRPTRPIERGRPSANACAGAWQLAPGQRAVDRQAPIEEQAPAEIDAHGSAGARVARIARRGGGGGHGPCWRMRRTSSGV
jgi:hypothetical protein